MCLKGRDQFFLRGNATIGQNENRTLDFISPNKKIHQVQTFQNWQNVFWRSKETSFLLLISFIVICRDQTDIVCGAEGNCSELSRQKHAAEQLHENC